LKIQYIKLLLRI